MKSKRIWISLWLLTLLAIFIVSLINRVPYFLLGGSSSVSPLMEELLNKYPDNHKKGDFNYVSSASAGAPPRVEKNTFGIGFLSESYQIDKTATPNLINFQIMRDGLIIVYNLPSKAFSNSNTLLDFDANKVKQLYSHNSLWRDVFPTQINHDFNMKVKPFTRPNGSGTRTVFDEKVFGHGVSYKANVVDSSGAMLNLESGSIGYTSFADFNQAKNISVTAGTWEQIEANYQNIEFNAYKLWRPFIGIINKTYKYQKEITKLLKWLFSDDTTVTNIFKKYGPKTDLDDETNQDLQQWLTEN